MKKLNVPYLSQTDNSNNPFGACNVTSIAMVLKSFGFVGDASQKQFEDQLYTRMLRNGWSRHNWWDLQKLVHTYSNMSDVVREDGTLADIRRSIDQNRPAVLHGFFTRGGHIIVVYGYDAAGFWVHDPYGEYLSAGAYDINTWARPKKGESLHYSNGLISRTCSPETPNDPKHIVMHSIGRVIK